MVWCICASVRLSTAPLAKHEQAALVCCLHGRGLRLALLWYLMSSSCGTGFELIVLLVNLQYSMWLDQHSMEEALRFIRSALEACASAAEKEPGFSDVYPFMLQLAKGGTH